MPSVTKYMIRNFMRDNQRAYPYGMSESDFNRAIWRVMRKDPELTLSQAVTLVQATHGSFNNPH